MASRQRSSTGALTASKHPSRSGPSGAGELTSRRRRVQPPFSAAAPSQVLTRRGLVYGRAMSRGQSRSLGGRANQAGVLFAAANAPLTFQRTLMPRATTDQALVTGLSASANHALVTLVQEAVQSAALLLVGQAGLPGGRRGAVGSGDDRRGRRRDCGRPRDAARVGSQAARAVVACGRTRQRVLACGERCVRSWKRTWRLGP
jgi:hypothetical protein